MAARELTCHWEAKRKPASLYVLALMPVTVIVLGLRAAAQGHWKSALLVLPFGGAIAVMIAWFMRAERRARTLSLTIDPARETITFRNFTFVSRFLPEQPRPVEEIPFADILASSFHPGSRGGADLLTLRTTRGRVTINSRMQHFDSIRTILEEIVEANEEDSARHVARLAEEPKIKTPVYGWFLLLVPVGGILWVCWKVFNS